MSEKSDRREQALEIMARQETETQMDPTILPLIARVEALEARVAELEHGFRDEI